MDTGITAEAIQQMIQQDALAAQAETHRKELAAPLLVGVCVSLLMGK